MTPELKSAWLTALRSGEYRQAKETLKAPDGSYCCLGVLCHLAKDRLPDLITEEEDRLVNFEDGRSRKPEADELTNTVAHALDLNPVIYFEAMERNDGIEGPSQDFTQIADWLEKVL